MPFPKTDQEKEDLKSMKDFGFLAPTSPAALVVSPAPNDGSQAAGVLPDPLATSAKNKRVTRFVFR